MTVVVGYRAGKVGLSGLHLAVSAARTLGTPLTVATIVPEPWLTPSLARTDAEYEHWADHLAADSKKEANRYLHNRRVPRASRQRGGECRASRQRGGGGPRSRASLD